MCRENRVPKKSQIYGNQFELNFEFLCYFTEIVPEQTGRLVQWLE